MKSMPPPFPWRFLAFLLVFVLLFLPIGTAAARSASLSSPTDATEKRRITAVILDAGHGGEDGGAVSATGIVEKELNLQIVFLLKELLEANGIRVILTRSRDELLYDKTADYHGRKKILDLSARLKIAQEHPEAAFVSIHMNTYPLESCHGLQVWYSPNDPASLSLASEIRESARTLLDPKNDRALKCAGSSIYLLQNIQSPAVLVECGFLTNPAEAERLAEREYQQMIALSIFLAIVRAEFDTQEA